MKLLLIGSVLAVSCGDSVVCGYGTYLDEPNQQCVAEEAPENVIVGDFTVGEFELTNVDIPEQMNVQDSEVR